MDYFDFASTTPMDPDAAEVYVKVATEYFGNSSSLHDFGGHASALLENCRKELAQLLGIDPQGLFFTSGGSEGNFLAIEALLSAPRKKGNHIISGMAEHSSVHGSLKRLEEMGYEITLLPMDPSGLINLELLLDSIRQDTTLIVIQHVNSEIGTIQPIEAISHICRDHRIHLHSDVVQSFGKLEFNTIVPFVDSFAFSGHKIYGPKGVGGVYINPRIRWSSFLPGTSHEHGFRPGTLNVPAIAAMTAAAQKITSRLEADVDKFWILRTTFIEALDPIKDRVVVYQAAENSQLPSILGLRIKGIQGQWMMLECNRQGFAISTGSACQLGMQAPTKVTQALSLNNEEAKEFIRISFGHTTTKEQTKKLAQTIITITNKYRP